MSFETLDYKFENNIAIIAMDRPDALNALSQQLTSDLKAAIAKATDEGARAVVLTGNGRAFCSGGDLREMKSMFSATGRIEAFLEEPLGILHEVIMSIRRSVIPFIAAVGGVCAGAGTNFALACDMIVAGKSSSFNEAFVRIGLSPDCGGTFFLPRAVGEKRAAEIMMLGGTISSENALAMGLINRVVDDGEVLAAALALAEQLAAGPTGSIGRIKKMLNASFSNDLKEQLALEHECQIESGRSNDFKEGVTAFFEKRKPEFSGK